MAHDEDRPLTGEEMHRLWERWYIHEKWFLLNAASIRCVPEFRKGKWRMVRIADGRIVVTRASKEEIEALIAKQMEQGQQVIRGAQRRHARDYRETSIKDQCGPKAAKLRVIRKGEFPGQHIRGA
jgi:hypothetical protein